MEQANKNFEKYQGLAVYYAKRYFKLCRTFGYLDNEVITWAFEALWKICIKMKNVSEGEFKTYLALRVKGEIIDIIRKDNIMFGSRPGMIKMTSFSGMFSNSNEDTVLKHISKIYVYEFTGSKQVEDEDFYNYITQGLSERESFIVKQRIFLNVNMYNISKALNLSPQTTSRIWTRDIAPTLKNKLHRLTA